MSQFFLGMFLAGVLHTQTLFGIHPSGELYTAVQCVQCGDWYIPMKINQLTCPCDYE